MKIDCLHFHYSKSKRCRASALKVILARSACRSMVYFFKSAAYDTFEKAKVEIEPFFRLNRSRYFSEIILSGLQ